MAEAGAEPSADRFAVKVTGDSHFAWLRTRAAVERTLMAWIRTAVSLIGFGFAIVQFFQRMQELPGAKPARHPDSSLYFGLALIACGILVLVISIWQYRWTVDYLQRGSFAAIAGLREGGMRTPAIPVAVLLILVGLFAFFAVLLRLV